MDMDMNMDMDADEDPDVRTTVLVWITEAGWPACVDAARERAADADVVLLHISDDKVAAAAHDAYADLLGRGNRPDRDPADSLEALSGSSAADILEAAAHRLGRPCELLDRHGRVEDEVIRAAADADLLILARDGDTTVPGPHSLAAAGRYVVDHAECPVLLVWPRGEMPSGELPGAEGYTASPAVPPVTSS
ncbi:universal stress protein [Streptomyces sp. NPDC088725]|uniref:universal stress protein n=1 Tax=Streptomyces sp. NPDC088725 TaxID=3365873 RepID=UPI0037FC549C